MSSGRSPSIKYNASGYVDLTAGNAIKKADRKNLKERRKRVMDKFYEIAKSEGLQINSYISLVEIEDEEKLQ